MSPLGRSGEERVMISNGSFESKLTIVLFEKLYAGK